MEGLHRFCGTGYVARQRCSCDASTLASYSSSQRGWALGVLTRGSHQKCERAHRASSGAVARFADASLTAAWKCLAAKLT